MSANLSVGDAEVRRASLDRRHAAVRASMAAANIDVLIAYGSGLHAFTGTNPGWYLSAYKQIGPHAAVVLPIDGDPLFIMTPEWDAPRYRERQTMDMLAVAPEAFLETVSRALKTRGLTGVTAVAGGPLQTQATKDAWEGVIGHAPIDAEKLVSDIMKIRDEWSLNCTRRAVAIAEAGYENLLESTHAGMREYQLAAELEIFMRSRGGEDNFQLMSASQHNQAGHMPTNRVLERGDLILAEITPAVEGEFIQICRSAVIGGPSDVQLEKYDLLLTALKAGMKAATPGTSVTELVNVMNRPIADAGYEEFTIPPYMRTRGHSMGLGSMEPEIAPGHEHYMAKDMVFVMHPNQYIPETGYIMCGEPVIITDEGAVPLTSKMGTLGSIEA